MPARLLTGAPVVEDLHREIETRLATLSPDAPRPTLALLVPEDPSARAYAKAIRKQFTKLNLNIRAIPLEETASEAEFVRLVKQLSDDASITGILALQPLPRSIPRLLLANLIPQKRMSMVCRSLSKDGSRSVSPT